MDDSDGPSQIYLPNRKKKKEFKERKEKLFSSTQTSERWQILNPVSTFLT